MDVDDIIEIYMRPRGKEIEYYGALFADLSKSNWSTHLTHHLLQARSSSLSECWGETVGRRRLTRRTGQGQDQGQEEVVCEG